MSILKKSKTAKVVAGIIGFSMVLSLFAGVGVQTANAQALTASQLVELLISLGIIPADKAAAARAALSSSGSGSVGTSYTFTRNLTVGSTGEDVRQLQIVLNGDGVNIASSGAGSPGNETTYFGALTKAGVTRFQNKYAAEILAPVGLINGTGYVGASTRAKLNQLTSATPPVTPPVITPPVITPPVITPPTAGGSVSVSGGTQPSASLAPSLAARIPFTKFSITAGASDVKIDSVTIERVGLSTDASLAGVLLLDENGNQIGISKTLNSNHQAQIGDGGFTVPAGTTQSFWVAGNMADNSAGTYSGQVVGISVVGINTTAAVSGSLPIAGTMHTANATPTIGTVTNARGPQDPNGAATKEVGTKGYTFSSIRVTAGSAEKVKLNSIRWNQSGSAGAGDFANLTTYVDGVAYPVTVSADGKYYTSNFGGIIIDKGAAKEISIKGDVAGGSGRTIAFDLYRTTDLNVSGETYGFGITPPTSGTGFASTNPWYDASVVTVSGGSLVVSKATSVAAQNVAINLANQPLGGFEVEVLGEPISVASIVFNVTLGSEGASADVDDITSVSLVDANGSVVAGPVDGSAASTAGDGKFTFTDTITFPVGKGVYSLKGKLGTDFTNDVTIAASTTPSSDWTSVTGQTTGNTVTPSPTTAVAGNTMTAKAASATISVSANPVAQTVVSGAQGFTFANYQIDATASGEDIRFNSLPLEYNIGGNTATNIKNCRLFDGATDLSTSSNKVDPSAAASSTTFTISGGVTIQKGTVKTLALKCDIAAGSTGSYAWGFDDNSGADDRSTATGLTSGQTAAVTENDSMGQLMTLTAGGSLTVSLDPSSPSYIAAAAGQSVTVGSLKFRATNEAIDLTKIALQLTNTSSSSASDVTRVTVWDGTTQVGEVVFAGSSTHATSTLTAPVRVNKDADKILTLKAELAAIGTSQPGTSGHLIAVDYDGTDPTGTQGVGVASGTTINHSSTSDTASSGVRVFKSVPTVAKIAVPTNTLSNGEQSLLRFRVTADAVGDVGIYKFTLRIATTTASVTGVNVYAYTDSAFSTPVSGLSSQGQMLATDLLASGNTTWVSASTDLNVTAQTSAAADTVVQVPAGQSRYFEVRGTVAGATTGASVSTQLQGDSAYASTTSSGLCLADSTKCFMESATQIDADTSNDDFIWSPNSTTSVTAAAKDFANGYGVPGLPTTNLTAEVLSR